MSSVAPRRGIDHLVIACRDLDAGAALYRRLGFQVGPRNRHPWGTENHIVQLDGSFLELIALGSGFVVPDRAEDTYRFAGFLAAFLARQEGLAMLVLDSKNADADAAAFRTAGIAAADAAFRFERGGKRSDGADVKVGFSLAFAQSALIRGAGFFVCEQHYPENFWSAAAQVHPNAARRLQGVVMAAENPAVHAEFLSAFTGEREMRASSSGIEIETARGRIDVLTPLAVRSRYGVAASLDDTAATGFVGFRVATTDLGRTSELLARQGLKPQASGGAVVVLPEFALGCAIIFEGVG